MLTVKGIPVTLDECNRYNMIPDQSMGELVREFADFDNVLDMFDDEINEVVEVNVESNLADYKCQLTELSKDIDKVIDKLKELDNDDLEKSIRELDVISSELYDFK